MSTIKTEREFFSPDLEQYLKKCGYEYPVGGFFPDFYQTVFRAVFNLQDVPEDKRDAVEGILTEATRKWQSLYYDKPIEIIFQYIDWGGELSEGS